MKVCKDCQFKGEKNFFIKSRCKLCFNKISREKYYIKTGRLFPVKVANNLCTTCLLEKPFFNGKKCKECFKADKKEINKNYQFNNKKKVNIINKRYKERNREKLKISAKLYRIKNKEKIKEYNKSILSKRKINAKKRRIDPKFKLRELISGYIRVKLKKTGNKKNYSICKYLPYTISQLKEHLEKQFEPWMRWDNWGKININWNDNDPSTWTWNIDHIIAHKKFNYTSMTDQAFKKCWALSNLRPLSAKENIIKGDK